MGQRPHVTEPRHTHTHTPLHEITFPKCQVLAWVLSLDFELGFPQLDGVTRYSMLLRVPLMKKN